MQTDMHAKRPKCSVGCHQCPCIAARVQQTHTTSERRWLPAFVLMILEAQKLLWFSPAHSHFISNVNGTELLHTGVYHTVLVAIRSSQGARQWYFTISVIPRLRTRPVVWEGELSGAGIVVGNEKRQPCLLYTSDAADE